MFIETVSSISANLIDNYVLSTAYGSVISSNNTGRGAMLQEIEAQIAQYSSVLEDTTCDFCRSLDGMEVDLRDSEGQALFEKYSPAQHDNCKCMWIYLLPGDPDIPDEIGGANEDFDDRVVDNFKQIAPGPAPSGEDWTLSEIVYNYAGYNVGSTPLSWEKEIKQFEEMEKIKIESKTSLANRRFESFVSKFDDLLEDVEIDFTEYL